MRTYIKYLLVSFIVLLTSYSFAQKISDKFVVVLDAGHGGKDPGRPTKFDTEKNVALKIVLALGKELEKNDDIKVIYTRKTDVFLELHERAAIANKADADLFVSIHCNAHNSQAYGAETYAMAIRANNANMEIAKQENEVIFLEDDYETHYEGFDPNSPESLIALTFQAEEYLDQSILLASYVQNNFTKKLKRKNRGVKQAGFWVLHNTYMPSILVETGFLTNKTEGKYLSSKNGQQQLSNQIAGAILKYKSELDENSSEIVFTDVPDSNPEVTNSNNYPEVIFKVQIAASKRKVATKAYNFKGLKDVQRIRVDNVYRYFYGETSNYQAIQELKEKAAKRGYDTCFIVAYKNGEKIPVEEALKTPSD